MDTVTVEHQQEEQVLEQQQEVAPLSSPFLARQPSGIRAVPSHSDDDDDDNDDDNDSVVFDDTFDEYPLMESNNSVENDMAESNINENNDNSRSSTATTTTTTTNSSSLVSSSNNDVVSSKSEDKDGFLSGGEDFEGDPDEEMEGEGENGGFVGRKAGVPVARVSWDEDEEVGSGEEDVGVGGVGVYEKVRVLGEEGEGERDGVEVTEEGDAVVDSIKVDVVEAVRSGVAVVGVVEEEKKEEEVKVKESVVDRSAPVMDETTVEVDGKDEGKVVVESDGGKLADEKVDGEGIDNGDVVVSGTGVSEEVEERKELVEEERGVGGNDKVKFTEEGDAVVDSIHVDPVEVVRSGTVVVGELEEKTELEKPAVVGELEEKTELEKPAVVGEVEEKTELEKPVVVGVLEESTELEKPAVEESAPVVEVAASAEESSPVDSEPNESVAEKVSGVEDSVVGEIKVDAVEAVRSGVAVVGDSGMESSGAGLKELEAPSGANVSLGNEFEPLVDNHVESAANNDAEGADSELQKEGLSNETEVSRSVEIKPETDAEYKQDKPAGDVLVASVGEEEKVQENDVVEKPNVIVQGEEGGESNSSYASVLLKGLNAANSDSTNQEETVEQAKTPAPEIRDETEEEKYEVLQDEVEVDYSDTDGESDPVSFGSSARARELLEELQNAQREAASFDQSEGADGQIVTDSEEEADSDDEEGEEKELFDSAALAALLKAATSAGSDSGSISITSQDGSRLFSVERPAGLGSSLRSVRPASRPNNTSLISPHPASAPSEENLSEEEKKKMQVIHDLKVKFLRLVQRLGHTLEESVAQQVLYRLALLGSRPTSPVFSLDNAKQTAAQLEAEGENDLNFSLNILVLGKSGVGKSATINAIFGEEKVKINAFQPETTSVTQISGIVDGVHIRVFEVPGLRTSGKDQAYNRNVLGSVKKYIKKFPVDIMLYVDRLDSQTRDLNDIPMLKTITSSLGSSIWRNAIVTLTHASSAPPEGPSGNPLSYEVFVAQRSHIVQQSISHSVGDLRLMNPSLMSPVTLAENHPACRKNREGQKVLPNGQTWRPQLLLLCYSMKILAEATSSIKPQDPIDHRKLFGFRSRAPPLPYLLSSLLQPRAHPKLSADQGGDNVDSDVDLDDLSESDEEGEDEYEELPPFKPLKKYQLAKLSKEQRNSYFEEYDYRVKLLQKKQWKEELKRMRDMKKRGKGAVSPNPEDFDEENGAPAAVPVPLPDMVLPPSFDNDNPAYRYRFLEPTSQFLARPVLDTHGWDHDCGYDGVNVEQNLGIVGRYPAAVTVQVTKDKKEFNIHLDSAVSAKHGENGSSLVGFDVQTIGKQLAYIVRGESKFKNLKKNKTAAGVSVTFLGENVATGVKVEDQYTLGKRLVLVGSTGTVRSQKDAAYGANLEVRLRDADYPVGQDQSSFVLSLMKWKGDLAIGANLQSQVSVGRSSKMAVRLALNNKLSGQITVRTSSSDNLQLALAGLIPIAVSIYRNFRPAASESNYLY